MLENVSGCFFLNTVYSTIPHRCTPHTHMSTVFLDVCRLNSCQSPALPRFDTGNHGYRRRCACWFSRRRWRRRWQLFHLNHHPHLETSATPPRAWWCVLLIDTCTVV